MRVEQGIKIFNPMDKRFRTDLSKNEFAVIETFIKGQFVILKDSRPYVTVAGSINKVIEIAKALNSK